MKNYIRYGVHKKKPLLKDAGKAFDGIVVPANILLYQFKATPGAVVYLEKPFFIDPMTYLFGENYELFKRRVKDRSEFKFKPSFEKLLIGHGLSPEVFLKLNYLEIRKEFLNNRDRLVAFVSTCISFQSSMVRKAIEEATEIDPSLKDATGPLDPEYVVPPYFLIDQKNFDESLSLNQQMLEAATELLDASKLRPLVYLNKVVLRDPAKVDALVNLYRSKGYAGFILWVDDFNEFKDATKDLIVSIGSFTKKLSNGDKPITLLHGGYFGMTLKHFGVDAICHGLGFGEVRSGVATAKGGGPPPVRYYVKDLHIFLTLPNALELLRQRSELLCDCPVCRRVVEGNPENITRYEGNDDMADLHYLYVRKKEKDFIADSSLEEILADFDAMLVTYDDIHSITRTVTDSKGRQQNEPILSSNYIKAWKEALTELSK